MADRAGRHACLLQARHRLVGRTRGRPGRDRRLDAVLLGAAAGGRGERRIVEADEAGQGRPHGVVGDGDRHPLVAAGRRKDAVRHERRMAVAGARRHFATPRLLGGRLLDRPGGGEGQHALDLGEVDELALAGLAAMQQGDQHGRTGVQSADRVAIGEMVHHRRIIGAPADAGQAGALLEGRAVGAGFAPRAAAPNAAMETMTSEGFTLASSA